MQGKEKSLKLLSKNTLFVSGIPFEATTDDLTHFFSEVGPLRSCFVIKPKSLGSSDRIKEDGSISNNSSINNNREKDPDQMKNNNGCGYVHFALAEDAERALKELKKKKFMEKRFLRMNFALPKKLVKKEETDNPNTVQKQVDFSHEIPKKVYKSKCILVSQLPLTISSKQIFKKMRKFGNVKEILFPFELDHQCKVIYSTFEEAENAISHLHEHTFKGVQIKAVKDTHVIHFKMNVRIGLD